STLKEIARQAMRERGFEADIPPPAAREAQEAGAHPATAGQRALRTMLWASIDNDDSTDLDQLLVADAPFGCRPRVLVAIALVASRVARGSAIDEHAEGNATTVYTPAAIFPMLPEQLSTDKTSLAEREDRDAIVIELLVDADGAVAGTSLYAARVR